MYSSYVYFYYLCFKMLFYSYKLIYPWLFSKQSSKLQECTFMSEKAVKLSGWRSKKILSWERNEKYQFREDTKRSMLLLEECLAKEREDGGKWKIEWFGRRGGEGEANEG
ncbi:hypothetical protein S245_000922 [Arachis hypogaea]